MKNPHIVYHKDGSIWAKGDMVDGVCEGYWEWFRKPDSPPRLAEASSKRGGGIGTKMRSGHFKNGKQVGEWITYDKKGKKLKVTSFST